MATIAFHVMIMRLFCSDGVCVAASSRMLEECQTLKAMAQYGETMSVPFDSKTVEAVASCSNKKQIRGKPVHEMVQLVLAADYLNSITLFEDAVRCLAHYPDPDLKHQLPDHILEAIHEAKECLDIDVVWSGIYNGGPGSFDVNFGKYYNLIYKLHRRKQSVPLGYIPKLYVAVDDQTSEWSMIKEGKDNVASKRALMQFAEMFNKHYTGAKAKIDS